MIPQGGIQSAKFWVQGVRVRVWEPRVEGDKGWIQKTGLPKPQKYVK